ncbi:MAG TPA: M50 family metallopeptidase [Anaerolineales bacterium]|nr:M50 family metallopeptidase [Anaerolineales bacterium]
MDTISSLLLFVVALASLIIVHEFGHFLAAKLSRIKVTEFGIGFPPRVARLFKIGETEFTLNSIPLGGFVRPAGDNDPGVPGGLAAASPWTRVFVLISGPAMNILVALFIYAFIFLQLGKPDLNVVQIMDVSVGSPAQIAGLQADDIVLQINEELIYSSGELHDQIYAHLGEPITISYSRNGETGTATLIPRDPPPADGAIGISMGHPFIPTTPVEALSVGGQAIWEQADALIALPGRLLGGGANADEGRLIGYKGMYDIYTQVREADAAPGSELPPGINTLFFFASISVSLGILNLLPVPALDGGRILFTLPEIVFRRRIPPAYENAVNLIGLALLLMLIVYINIQDFVNPLVIP